MIVEYSPFYNYEETLKKADVFLYDTTKSFIEPLNDFVISRNANGDTLSCYGDQVWDLTPYSKKIININFQEISTEIACAEIKRLLFLYIIVTEGKGGAYVSGETLYGIYITGLKIIESFLFKKNLTFKQFFESDKYIETYINYIDNNCLYSCIVFQTILSLLGRTSSTRSGFNYKPCEKNMKKLSSLIKKYEEQMSQTEVIPVSIYANAALLRWKHIEEVENNIKNIVAFLKKIIVNDNFAYSPNGCKHLKNGKTVRWRSLEGFVSWSNAINKYNLKKIFEKYNVKDRSNFRKFLRHIQGTCRHLIHMYTGMRDNECRTLESDCYQEANAEMPARIKGIETKIHGVPTGQVWITHPQIKRVIDILNSISTPIYDFYTPYLVKKPLIITLGFIGNKKRRGNYEYYGVTARNLNKHNSSELYLEKNKIIVTKSHIEDELMSISPERDWYNHKWLKVDEPWNFTSHQYRRSLAVYALSSGLVSIFALKEQFGHLLLDMTSYYGNGHLKSKKMVGIEDKDHIAKYMERIARYIEAMTFTKEVIFSDEELFAPSGVHFDKYAVAKTPEAREVILENLSNTINKFENGELRWHSTPLGGCVSPYSCDKYLFPTFFLDCYDCEYSVQKISKIERIISVQQKFVLELSKSEQDSIVHRTEVQKLIKLESHLEKLKKQKK